MTSETGVAQTALGGVVGPQHLFVFDRRNFWKGVPQSVIVAYLKSIINSSEFLSRIGHEKSGLNLGGPPSKAKKCIRSIANKYREGKVKRTPGRGVK